MLSRKECPYRHTNIPIRIAVMGNLQMVSRAEGTDDMAEWSRRRRNVLCNRSLITKCLNQGKSMKIIYHELSKSGHLMSMSLRSFERFSAVIRNEFLAHTDEATLASCASTQDTINEKNSSTICMKSKVAETDQSVQPRKDPPPPVTDTSTFKIVDAFSKEYPDES